MKQIEIQVILSSAKTKQTNFCSFSLHQIWYTRKQLVFDTASYEREISHHKITLTLHNNIFRERGNKGSLDFGKKKMQLSCCSNINKLKDEGQALKHQQTFFHLRVHNTKVALTIEKPDSQLLHMYKALMMHDLRA